MFPVGSGPGFIMEQEAGEGDRSRHSKGGKGHGSFYAAGTHGKYQSRVDLPGEIRRQVPVVEIGVQPLDKHLRRRGDRAEVDRGAEEEGVSPFDFLVEPGHVIPLNTFPVALTPALLAGRL